MSHWPFRGRATPAASRLMFTRHVLSKRSYHVVMPLATSFAADEALLRVKSPLPALVKSGLPSTHLVQSGPAAALKFASVV